MAGREQQGRKALLRTDRASVCRSSNSSRSSARVSRVSERGQSVSLFGTKRGVTRQSCASQRSCAPPLSLAQWRIGPPPPRTSHTNNHAHSAHFELKAPRLRGARARLLALCWLRGESKPDRALIFCELDFEKAFQSRCSLGPLGPYLAVCFCSVTGSCTMPGYGKEIGCECSPLIVPG